MSKNSKVRNDIDITVVAFDNIHEICQALISP